MTALLGTTVDISVFLRFFFWQEVHYKLADTEFPSSSKEGKGRIVGISEHVGHALTYMNLTDDTLKIIHQSLIRPAKSDDMNLRPGNDEGELPLTERPEPEPPPSKTIWSRSDASGFVTTDTDAHDTPVTPPECQTQASI